METGDFIDEEDYRVVKTLKALANGVRYRIVRLLMDKPHGVSELAETLNRSDSSISHQLRRLRSENLVHRKNDGRESIYSPKRRDVIEKVLELRPLLKRDQ